jgi:hypothetical protein
MDDANGPLGFSILGQMAGVIESVMNPTCASNVMSLMCHSWFKECRQVDGGSTANRRWLPSLPCRSECDKHMQTWKMCLDDLGLENDPVAKITFKTQMLAMVFS